MAPWIVLLASLVGCFLVHLALLASVSKAAGLRPKSVHVGFGPKILERTVGGVRVELRPIPLGGSVDNEGQADAPVGRRLAPVVVAALVLAGVGAVLLGVESAIDAALESVVAVVGGALSPLEEAKATIGRTLTGIAAARFPVIAGVVAIFVATWNLLLGVAYATVGRTRVGLLLPVVSLALMVMWVIAGVVAAAGAMA